MARSDTKSVQVKIQVTDRDISQKKDRVRSDGQERVNV